jgi:hypothetical protein
MIDLSKVYADQNTVLGNVGFKLEVSLIKKFRQVRVQVSSKRSKDSV